MQHRLAPSFSLCPHRTLTDRDTHEIIVDIDGWPASRAALSEVVAAVLGVPPHRIRPVLDVREEPVATYAYQEEADRVAEELASRGIDVVVRRRVQRRKSLRELTQLVDTSSPPRRVEKEPEPVVPEPAKAQSAAALARTMQPGWLSLDDSGPMSQAHDGTAVGLPSWSDSAGLTPAPPKASKNAIDPGAVSAMSNAAATADTVEFGGQAGVWGDILGSALADRLVGAGEETVVPSSSRDESSAAGTAPVAVSKRATPKPSVSGAPSMQDTLALAGGGTTQFPEDLRSMLSGEPPNAAESPAQKSAWAVAGVDVPVEVADAPPGILRSVAAIEQPMTEGDSVRLIADPDAFAGFDDAALAEAGTEAHEGLTVGDRFVRLRQPSAEEFAGSPEPGAVLVWGLLAPGGGFASLGEPARGLNYALGAIFVVPWIKGVIDARRVAADVKAGKILLKRKPAPFVMFLYVVGFWSVVVVAVMGISALLAVGDEAGTVAEFVVDVDTGSQTGVVDADSTMEPVETEPTDVEPEIDERERQRQLDRLTREARLACEEERYAECERLAGQALDLDGRHRQALILQVESVSRGVRTLPERPPETENDRQPDRPTP